MFFFSIRKTFKTEVVENLIFFPMHLLVIHLCRGMRKMRECGKNQTLQFSLHCGWERIQHLHSRPSWFAVPWCLTSDQEKINCSTQVESCREFTKTLSHFTSSYMKNLEYVNIFWQNFVKHDHRFLWFPRTFVSI